MMVVEDAAILNIIDFTGVDYNHTWGFCLFNYSSCAESQFSFSIRQEFTFGNICGMNVSGAFCLFYGEFNNEYCTIGHCAENFLDFLHLEII